MVRKVSAIMLTEPGVAHTVSFGGLDPFTFTNASNAGAIFTALEPFDARDPKGADGR